MKLDNPKVKQTICWQLFGKRYADLTDEEKKVYKLNITKSRANRLKNLDNPYNYKQGFCYKHFGKRCRELTAEEKREFNRIQKQIQRSKNGIRRYSKKIA